MVMPRRHRAPELIGYCLRPIASAALCRACCPAGSMRSSIRRSRGSHLVPGFPSRRNRLNERFLARAADGGNRARSPLLAPYGSVLEAIPTWTKLGGLAGELHVFLLGVRDDGRGHEGTRTTTTQAPHPLASRIWLARQGSRRRMAWPQRPE